MESTFTLELMLLCYLALFRYSNANVTFTLKLIKPSAYYTRRYTYLFIIFVTDREDSSGSRRLPADSDEAASSSAMAVVEAAITHASRQSKHLSYSLPTAKHFYCSDYYAGKEFGVRKFSGYDELRQSMAMGELSSAPPGYTRREGELGVSRIRRRHAV